VVPYFEPPSPSQEAQARTSFQALAPPLHAATIMSISAIQCSLKVLEREGQLPRAASQSRERWTGPAVTKDKRCLNCHPVLADTSLEPALIFRAATVLAIRPSPAPAGIFRLEEGALCGVCSLLLIGSLKAQGAAWDAIAESIIHLLQCCVPL